MTPDALDAFLDSVHDNVPLPVGARERLAAERLRRAYAGDDLRDALTAMLSRNAEEQAAVAHLFDLHRRRPVAPMHARRGRSPGGLVIWALCVVVLLLLRPRVPPPPPPLEGPTNNTTNTTGQGAPPEKGVRLVQVAPQTEVTDYERAPLPELPLRVVLELSILSLLLMTLGWRWLRLPAVLRRARPEQDAKTLAAVRKAHKSVIEAGLLRKVPLMLYRVPAGPPLTPAEREDLATLFGHLRRSEHGDDLDVPGTLAETLSSGNRPTPLFLPLHRQREILVLYDREQRDDYPDLSPFLRLLDDWERRGLRISRYAFHRHPDRLLPEHGGASVPLSDVCRQHPHAALLLFSRRRHIEAHEQRPWLPLLQQFELRALIDPDPREKKPARQDRLAIEALEQAGLRRFPFTVTGLSALARHLAEGGLGAGPPRWPEFSGPHELAGPLRLWAAAAALVPEASWDQLEGFRQHLPDVSAVFGDRRDVHRLLFAVARHTPHGAESDDGRTIFLPKKLVRELVEWLVQKRPDIAQKVSAILETQLGEEPPCKEHEDPYAFWTWSYKVARLRTLRDRTASHLVGLLESPFGEDVRDQMRHELEGPLLPAAEKERLKVYVGGSDKLPWRDLVRGHLRLWLGGAAVAAVFVAGFVIGHRFLPGPQQKVVRVRPAEFKVAEGRHEPATADRPALIEVLPGRFFMGSPDNEDGHEDDEPRHEVAITTPYFLSATEVTQVQYKAVMKTNPSRFKGDDRPVETVSWDDAVEYCNRLSEKEKRSRCYSGKGDNIKWDRTCTGYRLPTEAEWEYAARADQKTLYSGSDDPAKVAWFGEDLMKGQTHPVGQKDANDWGFHDMSGHVWEWVWDFYAKDYGKRSDLEVDPIGPTAGPGRVFRGGSFWDTARYVRVADRLRLPPGIRDYDLGFRVARSSP